MNGYACNPIFLQNSNQNETQLNQVQTGRTTDIYYNPTQFNININPQIFDFPFYESILMHNNEKFLINKENNKHTSFYSTFKFLKFKYKIENTRRNQIDCLVKRIKTKFHNSLHLAIKNSLNISINRLPQFFITNVKINFNKLYLNKTIDEIYTEYKILPSLEEIMAKKIYRKDQKEFVKVLFCSQLKSVYNAYLLSQLYKKHINYIQIKEGINFAKIYNYVSKYILDYFLCDKAKKNKQKKNEKKIENNNSTDNNNISNINNNMIENGFIDDSNRHNSINITNDNTNKKVNIAKNGKLFIVKKY